MSDDQPTDLEWDQIGSTQCAILPMPKEHRKRGGPSPEDIAREQRAEAMRFAAISRREFHGDQNGHYTFTIIDAGIVFDLDRVRRERNELVGELSVSCGLPGSQTVGANESLAIADFNLSSLRARQDREIGRASW